MLKCCFGRLKLLSYLSLVILQQSRPLHVLAMKTQPKDNKNVLPTELHNSKSYNWEFVDKLRLFFFQIIIG